MQIEAQLASRIKRDYIGTIVSIFLAHVSTPKLEKCIRNVNDLPIALIHMKLWIPSVAMLRSLKLPTKMESCIYNNAPPPCTSCVQHCKTPPIILVPQGLLQSQLPLVFLPLFTLVCLLNCWNPSSFTSFGYMQMTRIIAWGAQNVHVYNGKTNGFIDLAYAKRDQSLTQWGEVYWRSRFCFQYYPSLKLVCRGELCPNKSTGRCNVVAQNTKWEAYLMHTTIYHVKQHYNWWEAIQLLMATF